MKNLAWKVILPVAIGLAVVFFLFKDDYSAVDMGRVRFDARAWIGIAIALVFVCGRDFGLAWRFHTIAAPDLSWKRSLRVDLMCAFTSAITPSAVGGSALAIFYLNTEGVKVGRATALTLTTLFFDELFFVLFCPLIVLFVPSAQLFGSGADRTVFLQGVEVVFWVVYAGIVAWTAILYMGILWRPQAVKSVIMRIFRLRWLRRWQPKLDAVTDNMVATSVWIRTCSRRWWLNVFGATVVSWFSRYMIVSALFWGFVAGSDMLLVFARQFVVWVVLMVSPTPGSSGISEWMFTEYYGDLIGNASLALVMALIWRLITYYIYLVIGICLIPAYFKKKK